MRNLKKVLSLALALVMLLGMMMVGAGAATTKADLSEANQEAIAVLKATKVMTNSRYDDPVTRAEAAKMVLTIYNPTLAKGVKNTKNSVYFTDVKNHWAAGYIDVCFSEGIISGRSSTVFDPNGSVTGYELGKMILKAMGKDGKYTGKTWTTNVLRDVTALGLSANTGISNWGKAVTRLEAAQLTFNGMTKSVDGSTGYIVDGGAPATTVVFNSMIEAMLYQANQPTKGTIKEASSSNTLAAVNFNLTKAPKTDAFGHMSTVWKIGDKEICAVANGTETPAKTFTYQAITDNDLKGLTWSDNAADVKIIDGNSTTGAVNAALIKTLGTDYSIVELYAGADKKINKVIVVNTYAAQVSAVTAATATAKRFITVDGLKYETEDFEKNNIVLYTKSWNKDLATPAYEVKNVEIAQSFTGTLTRVSSDNKTFTVSGTAYGLSTGTVSSTDADDVKAYLGVADQVFYLDAAGKNIIFASAAEGQAVEVKDYAMILAADVVLGSSFGTKSYTLQVKALLSNGTIGTYTVPTKASGDDFIVELDPAADITVYDKDVDDSSDNATKKALCDAAIAKLEDKVFTYTLKDNTMTLKTALATAQGASADGTYASAIKDATESNAANTDANAIKAGKATVTVGTDTNVLLNNSTAFVLTADSKEASQKVGTAALGGTIINKNTAAVSNETVYVVVEKKGELRVATCVFAIGVAEAAADTGNYVYVDGTYETGKDATGADVYYYNGTAPDGSKIEVTGPNNKGAGIFTYNTSNVLGNAPAGVADGTVTVVSGNVIGIKKSGSTTYLTTNDATKTVSVDGKTELKAGANVVYVAKDGVIVTAYVTGMAPTYTAAKKATPVTVSAAANNANAGFQTAGDWEVTLSKTEGLNAGDTVTVTIKYKGSETDANDKVATVISAGAGHGTITQAANQTAVLADIQAGLTGTIKVDETTPKNLTDIAVAITVTEVAD